MSSDGTEPEVWLIRHGETEWSRSGRHTGTTDLALTPAGESAARALRNVLSDMAFDLVLCSPRQRARRTAELAGVTDPEIDTDLVEWDYGDYEGLTRIRIHEDRPGWSIWDEGAPGGESPQQVSDRVDRVIARCRDLLHPFDDTVASEQTGDAVGRILLVAHGHVLRSLAARWIEQPVTVGAHIPLDTAKVCVLSYDRGTPTLDRWNADT